MELERKNGLAIISAEKMESKVYRCFHLWHFPDSDI